MRNTVQAYGLFFMLLMVLGSCSRGYYAHSIFRGGRVVEKGDLQLESVYGDDLESTGIHTSVSYSPIARLGLTATYAWVGGHRDESFEDVAWKRSLEVGLGTYFRLTPAVLFDIYGGYGHAETLQIFNDNRESYSNTTSVYYYLQPGLTTNMGVVEFSFAMRFRRLHYTLVGIKNPLPRNEEDFLEGLIEDNPFMITEATGTFSIGSPEAKVLLGMGFSNAPTAEINRRSRGLVFAGFSVAPSLLWNAKKGSKQKD